MSDNNHTQAEELLLRGIQQREDKDREAALATLAEARKLAETHSEWWVVAETYGHEAILWRHVFGETGDLDHAQTAAARSLRAYEVWQEKENKVGKDPVKTAIRLRQWAPDVQNLGQGQRALELYEQAYQHLQMLRYQRLIESIICIHLPKLGTKWQVSSQKKINLQYEREQRKKLISQSALSNKSSNNQVQMLIKDN